MTAATDFPEPSTPYVTDEADILHDIRDQLSILVRDVSAIRDRMDKTEALIAGVVDEVKPTIDELMQSSLFKMLGMKKK
jgi:hypothetical protein